MRRDIKAALWRLLRFLLLRLDAVPTGSGSACGRRCGPLWFAVDWASSCRTSLLAWWLPPAARVVALFASVSLRSTVWVCGPRMDGRRVSTECPGMRGPTHCRYTGRYYLAMVVPVLALGAAGIGLSPYGWAAFGALILGGGYAIWWVTERAWGKFSMPSTTRLRRAQRCPLRVISGHHASAGGSPLCAISRLPNSLSLLLHHLLVDQLER